MSEQREKRAAAIRIGMRQTVLWLAPSMSAVEPLVTIVVPVRGDSTSADVAARATAESARRPGRRLEHRARPTSVHDAVRAGRPDVTWLDGPPGRGVQLNAGAARGDGALALVRARRQPPAGRLVPACSRRSTAARTWWAAPSRSASIPAPGRPAGSNVAWPRGCGSSACRTATREYSSAVPCSSPMRGFAAVPAHGRRGLRAPAETAGPAWFISARAW